MRRYVVKRRILWRWWVEATVRTKDRSLAVEMLSYMHSIYPRRTYGIFEVM
jgi:hypothetical protein